MHRTALLSLARDLPLSPNSSHHLLDLAQGHHLEIQENPFYKVESKEKAEEKATNDVPVTLGHVIISPMGGKTKAESFNPYDAL